LSTVPYRPLLAALVLIALAACAARQGADAPVQPVMADAAAPTADVVASTALPTGGTEAGKPLDQPEIVHGAAEIGRPAVHQASTAGQAGEFTLNFENVEIKDVVKAVLGDMLQLNYTVATGVQGTMTLHTAQPLPGALVLPGFEAALRLAGAALIQTAQGYDVVPLQDAARRAGLGLPAQIGLAPGFRLELVALKYVAAAEMQRVLEPVSQPGTIVRVDPARNLIVLAGTEVELANLIDTIAIFDVDALKAQSFALYPLHFAPAKSVAAELTQLVGGQGPSAGLVRIVPIDRLNAILVVSPQPRYVDEMKDLVERFDRGGDKAETRLYVYHVQNGNAAELAGVLGKVVGQPKSTTAAGAGAAGEAGTTLSADAASPGTGSLATPALLQNPPVGAGGSTAAPANAATDSQGGLRITADDANNALLIMATPAQYKLIEGALQQLDTVPLQVLIEASVAQVTLTKQLSYGVQSFFRNGPAQTLIAQNLPGSALGLTAGGLSFAFTRGTSTTVILDLLSSITKVKMLSAPSVTVLNNHTASLDVGQQIPIATGSSVSTQSADAPIVNAIQQQNTGIILKVTPRFNESGLVQMDLSQEVSMPSPTPSVGGIQSPTIDEQKIETTVAIEDGQTLALAGLISDSQSKSINGIPVLSEIPVLGALFEATNGSDTRMEILVLVTPHIVRDAEGARSVTEELRAKLPLTHVFDPKR
jgi:general secretion pathway protein D